VDSDDALIAAGERVTDADLGPGVSAELLDDVAAAADDASDLANGAEVAEDGVLGCYKRRVIGGGVSSLVFGAGVGIGVGVGALAVGTTLTGHRREWAVCRGIAYGYVRFPEMREKEEWSCALGLEISFRFFYIFFIIDSSPPSIASVIYLIFYLLYMYFRYFYLFIYLRLCFHVLVKSNLFLSGI